MYSGTRFENLLNEDQMTKEILRAGCCIVKNEKTGLVSIVKESRTLTNCMDIRSAYKVFIFYKKRGDI